jgi:exodeoxyribonuclease VII small subunit
MSDQKKKKAKDNLDVESTMKSIERLVEKLENSEVSLSDSLQAFEEGINQVRHAQNSLAKAEQKVLMLLDKNEQPTEKCFDLDEEGG